MCFLSFKIIHCLQCIKTQKQLNQLLFVSFQDHYNSSYTYMTQYSSIFFPDHLQPLQPIDMLFPSFLITSKTMHCVGLARNMPTTCTYATYGISFSGLCGGYVYICLHYKVIGINHLTRGTVQNTFKIIVHIISMYH